MASEPNELISFLTPPDLRQMAAEASNDLIAMLKRKSEGFESKKSNVLTPENINKFLNEAPDNEHLDKKVTKKNFWFL